MSNRTILRRLKELEKVTPHRTDSATNFVRGLAFTYQCRSLRWTDMIEHLIAIYEPLAVAERVRERLTS